MKLVVIKGWTGQEELISEEPTEQQISALIKSLDWQQFNSVRLERDSKNWMDVSGNLSEDGLAIVFEENGIYHVSSEAPKTITELEETLRLFLKSDQRFNHGFSSSLDIGTSYNNEKGDNWKVQYEAKQKIDKRNQRIAIIAGIIITGLIGSMLYLWFTDDLKFFGRETDYITATVSGIQWKPIKGGFIQLVTYKFDFRGNTYRGHFTGTKFTGKHKIGDLVKVKFAINQPSISKRVATLKRNT